MITIASEDFCGEYGYELGIPDGGTVEENEDGSLTVLDGDEIPVAAIEKPWAVPRWVSVRMGWQE